MSALRVKQTSSDRSSGYMMAYLKPGKSDANDAEAICEAAMANDESVIPKLRAAFALIK
jgi:transposase